MTQDIVGEKDEKRPGRPRFRKPSLDRYGRSSIFGAVAFRAGRDPNRLGLVLRAAESYDVPYYPQMTAADCGPACLRMVLASRGVHIPAQQLREEAGSGRNGVSASRLLELGRRHGLDGRGVRTNLSGLAHLASGSILFWRFNHFVVLVKATRSHVVIIDPAVGRRIISWSEADVDFTGLALEFTTQATTDRPDTQKSGKNSSIAVAVAFLPRTAKWLGALAASALLLVYALTFPFVLARMVTAGADAVHGGASGQLRWAAVLICAAVSFGILHFIRSRLIVSIQTLLEERAAHQLMGRLSRLPLDFFHARHPGDLAQRVRSTARLRQVVSVTTVGAVLDALLVIGYVLIIGYKEFWLSLAVVVCIVGFVLVTAVSWQRHRQLSSDLLEARTKSSNELHEILTNMTTVKSLGAEIIVHARWLNSFANELTSGTRQRRHAGTVSSFMATLQFAAPLLVLLIGLSVTVGSGASLSAAVSLGALSSGLFASLSNLSLASAALVELLPDLYRIDDVLTSPVERRGVRGMAQEDRPPCVRLESVSYAYTGATTASVREATAEISSGRLLAIIGPSGSGKSTLGMLISGLLSPTSGRILIDGVDLAEIDPIEYRRHIGYVDQNSTLMSGSILDNIRFSCPDVSLDDVRAAARLAEIDEFICTLPMKYETLLGAGGAGVSGGQRQRMALARALVKKPSLLILDESTSAVDPDTESAILRNIQGLGITTIVLGHRAALTVGASSILRLTDGVGELTDLPGSHSTEQCMSDRP
ncbi:peptidase domain-containing ABC transporter [Nocardia abscessus]|uniref:peptidase domain-containing ABC transporter n=1 Tax=Nocardia abscessus TaxID=120957 RepID=UPI002457CD73|nr:peptidase domain-containing ABC transporter [Nocardia abscessus]